MNEESFARIRSLLGPPAHEVQGVLLYQGDCVAMMDRLGEPLADLVVTSPPYNIGKEYEEPLSLPEYVEWCSGWMKKVHSITSELASFWLNLGYVNVPDHGKAVPLAYLLWDKSPFFLQQEVVWNYGAGVASRRTFSPRNEKFLWFTKDERDYHFDLDAVRDPDVKYPNQKKNGKLKCNPLGKNPTDVWQIPKVTSGANRSSRERTPHPAQFPVKVIERIVRACSKVGDLVIDPFVGSGTTALVAACEGRYAIGFDLRADYLELAAQRLRTIDSLPDQGRLFERSGSPDC